MIETSASQEKIAVSGCGFTCWPALCMLFASHMSLAADDPWRTTGQPISEHYDTIAISSNPQNYAIRQDSKGYIYIANGNGLLVYDGSNWQSLSIGDQQRVSDFVIAGDGRIYTGSAGQVGYFAAGANGQWLFNSLLGESASMPTITAIFRVLQVDDDILFLSQGHLYHYSSRRGARLISDAFYPVDMTSHGDQVVVSTQGNEVFSIDIADLDSDRPKLHAVAVDFEGAPQTAQGFINLSGGGLLMHTDDRLYARGPQGRFAPFATDIDPWLGANTIKVAVGLPGDRIAVATRRGGIALLTEDGRLLRFYNANHGLADTDINDIFVDRDNNFWISSNSDGVTRVELDSGISRFPSDTEFQISASTVAYRDRVVMGAQHGLFILDPAASPLGQADFRKLDFNLRNVLALLGDADRVLVGHRGGVSQLALDVSGQPSLTLIHDGAGQNGSGVRSIIRLAAQPDTALAVSANGLINFKKAGGEWTSRGLLPGFDENLYSIQEDADGTVWVGSKTGRFYRLDRIDQWPDVAIAGIDYPTPEPATFAGVQKLDEYLLFNNGYGEGVNTTNDESRLVPADLVDWRQHGIEGLMKVSQVEPGSAWFLSWSNDLEMDRAGQLQRLDTGQYEVDFSALDRLDLQFTLGLYQTTSGVVWINSKGQVVRYDPGSARTKTLFTPTVTRVDDVASGETLFANNRLDDEAPVVQLGADDNAIRVVYSAVDFSRSRSVEFRYRLTGSQDEWSEWNRRSDAIFTNVATGTNRFDVQYRTAPNRVSPVYSLTVQRAAFWFQTAWARAMFAAMLLAAIVATGLGIAQVKNRKLKLQAARLESEVAERTEVIVRQNAQLKEQNVQLEELDRAKSRLFTNVSHEFRTPLTLAIAPIKDVIAGGRVDDERDVLHLTMALENNLHMLELLGQVLDINKLETGNMPLSVCKLDMVAELERCLRRFELVAQKRGVVFQKTGFQQPLFIYFDHDHLEKVFLNLLSNAVKFSPTNSEVEITLKPTDDWIDVCIADQGPGISDADLPRIFDRFYQGEDSTYTPQPGTGIGLALVKELLSLHQASIAVESGRGSTFTASLRTGFDHYDGEKVSHDTVVATESMLAPPDYAGSPSASSAVQDELRKTVLIVDDNEDLRRYVRSILEFNYRVVEAQDGRKGLERSIEEQPDLIVADVMMPEMDGMQLAQELRDGPQTAHIPLILLTARSTKRDTVEGLTQGADDYISKPFDSAELVARIEAHLAQKQRIAKKLLADIQGERPADGAANEFADKFPRQLDALISERLGDERFDVEQMCQGLNVTRSTLFRLVKKHFGMTPKQLLKQRRLELSLQILQAGQGSVSEVAYAVGFQSLSSYSRAFSEHFGVPPTRHSELDAAGI